MRKHYANDHLTKETDMCYATKTSEVCAIIRILVKQGTSLKEAIKLIMEFYEGITEAYITEKYISFSNSNKLPQ